MCIINMQKVNVWRLWFSQKFLPDMVRLTPQYSCTLRFIWFFWEVKEVLVLLFLLKKQLGVPVNKHSFIFGTSKRYTKYIYGYNELLITYPLYCEKPLSYRLFIRDNVETASLALLYTSCTNDRSATGLKDKGRKIWVIYKICILCLIWLSIRQSQKSVLFKTLCRFHHRW